jgi:hypothetical protein
MRPFLRSGGEPQPTLAHTLWFLSNNRQGQVDTRGARPLESSLSMGVSKIQIGQLWKKDGTRDIYLVTRLYTEALSTMVVMRKSGAEGEALIRVRAERNSTGHNIPGFSPAQEEEKL